MTSSTQAEFDKIQLITKELLENLEQIKKEKKEDPAFFTKANVLFSDLINELNKLPEQAQDKYKKNLEDLAKFISENNIPVLTLAMDPNVKSGGVDLEMKETANVKKNAFNRKGLVIVQNFNDLLTTSPVTQFLSSLVTKVSFIHHWSGSIPKDFKIDPKTTLTDPANNLINKLCPLLTDSKQYPRLKRLTLLGCKTAPEAMTSLSLFITDQIEKIDKVETPAYVTVLDLKNKTADLFFLDEKKDRIKIETISLDKKDNEYFSKILPVLKTSAPSLYKNNSQFYGAKSRKTLTQLHKLIYNHTGKKNLLVNDQVNLHFEKLIDDDNVLNYLQGNADKSEKTKAKKMIPGLGTHFFTIKDSDKPDSNNLALLAESIINNKRKPIIQIKAYTTNIQPSGQSIVPTSIEDLPPSGKAIIYQR